MNSVETEADLLRCFRELDRGEVELAPDVRLPLQIENVFTWTFGPRAYLLLPGPSGGLPRGVVFYRNGGSTPSVATMCQWCHRVRAHGRVKLLSARAGDRRWVGQYLCSDLGCLTDEELPSVDDLRETADPDVRARRTRARIEAFVSSRLF